MFGFSSIPREVDALVVELVEDLVQRPRGRAVARLDVVVGVHQHLGLDDRHDPLLLAERRVARERVRVDLDAVGRGDAVADRDHRAPLGEAGAEAAVLLAAARAARRGPRSPSRPGAPASSLAPVSTLIPGMIPLVGEVASANGVPSADGLAQIVSS